MFIFRAPRESGPLPSPDAAGSPAYPTSLCFCTCSGQLLNIPRALTDFSAPVIPEPPPPPRACWWLPLLGGPRDIGICDETGHCSIETISLVGTEYIFVDIRIEFFLALEETLKMI